MGPDFVGTAAPTQKEINQEILLISVSDRLKETEADLKSLKDSVRLKNDKIIKLEAENVRLKMERTDKELSSQIAGLRIEVGKKDKELVDLRRTVQTLKENEALTLRRAADAEQKISIQQTTMGTMQKARDAANLKADQSEEERLAAVRKSIEYEDRLKQANARIAELENKGKPIAKDQNALKMKKK